jgi:hypothetical protein
MSVEAAFAQADLNANGSLDLGEFSNYLAGSSHGGVSSWGASYGGSLGYGGGYDASYSVGSGLVGGGYDASYYGSAGYGGAGYASAGYAGDASLYLGGGAYDSSLATSSVYATNAQGLYQDPNPTIIHRANPSGVQTYQQNVQVRFLQPPPLPPPGPLIIREVRPPQPPVPPPLRLRQQAPPLPQPPPLVLRERPPVAPPAIASQTVIRRLPGIPVPPRSVIIERLPPAPPRPRDVFIERWLPYGPRPARRTIVQRAAAPAPYPAPRNVIIQYEQAQARVVRNFQNLGVTQANPALYVQQYGATLLDAGTLLSQARAAGVVEDLGVQGYVGYGAASYGQGAWGGEVLDGGLGLGGAYGYSGYDSYGGGYGGSWGSWGSSSYSGGYGGDDWCAGY